MSSVTAASAASFRIGTSTSTNLPAQDLIHGPIPVKPEWLASTQRSIRSSIVPYGRDAMNDGRWLRQHIADAASSFFQETADLLPGEPYVYSSQGGDLVAEFKAKHGTLTSIVSSTFVLLFAVVDGVPVERKLFNGSDVRAEVQRLTGLLYTGQHGALESTK
jgi:hypothetical protein